MAYLFSQPKVRDWFYHRARRGTGEAFRALARPGQTVVMIGDAVAAGKSKPAIASAFEAALLPGGRDTSMARSMQDGLMQDRPMQDDPKQPATTS